MNRPQVPRLPDGGLLTESLAHQYAHKLLHWIETHRPSNFYTRAELDAGYLEYRLGADEAKTFKNTFVDFVSLATAFQHLTGLKNLYVSTSNNLARLESNKASRATNLVEYSSGLLPRVPAKKAQKSGTRQTTSILLAVFSALPKLEKLEIYTIYWKVIADFFPRGLELDVFAHLRVLDLK